MNSQHTIKYEYKDEPKLRDQLKMRDDADAKRMTRFLEMPDLTRTPGSPIYEMVQRIVALPDFAGFAILEVPEIVPTDVSFDLFDFPPDHPARSRSDTYYVDDGNILRTHTTVMWYYYLMDENIKQRINNKESVGSLCYGKVYRRDELDRNHMNVFHQIDGWYLTPTASRKITDEDLKEVLASIAKAIFGQDIKYRFNEDTFPYTDPSLEMEIQKDGRWIEVLGSGVVKGSTLDKLGVDPNEYNGWAFGFGLERLAMLSTNLPDIRLFWSQDERVKKQLKLGHKYEEVSPYPQIERDISFVVDDSFVPNDYFDLVRDIGGDLVEEVRLLDKYEDEDKFGKGKVSYTYRIIYRSMERTLTNEEIEPLQKKLYEETAKQFRASLR